MKSLFWELSPRVREWACPKCLRAVSMVFLFQKRFRYGYVNQTAVPVLRSLWVSWKKIHTENKKEDFVFMI